jgi:hypothetical protein
LKLNPAKGADSQFIRKGNLIDHRKVGSFLNTY